MVKSCAEVAELMAQRVPVPRGDTPPPPPPPILQPEAVVCLRVVSVRVLRDGTGVTEYYVPCAHIAEIL